MKRTLTIIALLIIRGAIAQDVTYSIHVPPGQGSGAGRIELSDPIDSNYYYSWDEIEELASPDSGREIFYQNMNSLEYPPKAKKQKIQSLMTIGFQIDEKGYVDSVFTKDVQIRGRWTKCEDCESLIMDYIKTTKWSPGKTGGVEVKTLNYIEIAFEINDPNSTQLRSPFGY